MKKGETLKKLNIIALLLILFVYVPFTYAASLTTIPKEKALIRSSTLGVLLVQEVNDGKNNILFILSLEDFKAVGIDYCKYLTSFCIQFFFADKGKPIIIHGFKSLKEAKQWFQKNFKVKF